MKIALLAASAGFALITVVLVLVERQRTRATGPDTITVFSVLFGLQCCLAGAVICVALAVVDGVRPTGIAFMDNIFAAIDPTVLWSVVAMTALFAVFFYVGCGLGQFLGARREVTAPRLRLEVHHARLLSFLALGAALTWIAFNLLGDSFVLRYANLILLRGDDLPTGRTVLNSNAFQLTQTWGWLAVVPLFSLAKTRRMAIVWWLCLGAAVGFAVMGVSRRALFLPMLMGYLGVVLTSRRWHLGLVVAAAGPIVLWVAFGKDLISSIAYGGTIERALGVYDSWANAVLRAASDVGTTMVESMGTLALIELPPRLGVDHLLSVAQRFPEGLLGLEVDWPERMVRISTQIFVGDWHQDVPPGLVGQMWLDFRFLGPVVWGLAFGLQMSLVQYFWERTARTASSAIVFVIITFAVALPVNSGSFDFTFSVDIIALALVLYVSCTLRSVVATESSEVAGTAATAPLSRPVD